MNINANITYSPFFSIIVPTYNVEAYIKKCINSVLKQTFTNFEIIIVDDFSTDNSLKICKELQKKDSRIKIIEHKKNYGLAASRNTGISFSTGKWILVIDSDDFINSKNFIDSISKKCKDNDMVYFGFSSYDNNVNEITKKRLDNIEKHQSLEIETLLYNLYKSKKFKWNVWSNAYKSSFLKNNNITYNSSLRQVEDCDYFFKVLFYKPKIKLLNNTDYIYRQREGSLTKSPEETTMYATKVTIDLCQKAYSIKNDNKFKDCLLKILSYNYYTLLLNIQRNSTNEDKNKYFKELKKINFMKNYSIDKKTKISQIFIKIFGVKTGSFLISLLHRIF